MKNLLISVIIPVLNRGNVLGETLDSLLAQSYSNWECIIIDDGSIDNTSTVVQNYILKDERFQYFNRPPESNKGASACRNLGIVKAKGNYIQFLDSDDLLEKNKFRDQLSLLEGCSPFTLATCKWGSFTSSSSVKVKTKYKSYRNFKPGVKLLNYFGKYNEYFPPLVYLVPMELIEKTGKWDETLSNNDDGEYFTKIVLNTEQIIFCESTSVYYRAGEDERLSQLNTKEKILSAIKSWQLIEKHLSGYPKIATVYIENGKTNILNQISASHLNVIEEYKEFFVKDSNLNWLQRLITSKK